MKRLSTLMIAAASLAAFGACKNGPNNARDTTGMTNTSAAGSLGDTVGGATGAPGSGAVVADTTKKKDSSYKKP